MSKLYMNQLAVTNMVYMRFSFDYFLDSCDRLGVHKLELYGCSPHYHFYDSEEDPTPAMAKKLRERLFFVRAKLEEADMPYQLLEISEEYQKITGEIQAMQIRTARTLQAASGPLMRPRISFAAAMGVLASWIQSSTYSR